MDSRSRLQTRTQSGLNLRVYDDFEPRSQWIQHERNETLLLDVHGFRKEHLKVQMDSHGNMRISGERPLLPLDENKWSRFSKEFQVPESCNASQVKARFDNGVLTISMPRLIIGSDASKPQHPPPKNKSKDQNNDESKKTTPEIPENEKKAESEVPPSTTPTATPVVNSDQRTFGKKMGLKKIVSVMVAILLLAGLGFYVIRSIGETLEELSYDIDLNALV